MLEKMRYFRGSGKPVRRSVGNHCVAKGNKATIGITRVMSSESSAAILHIFNNQIFQIILDSIKMYYIILLRNFLIVF